MRTVRALALIPAALMLLGACGDDTSSPTTVDTAIADDSSSGVPLSGPVQIDVVVGTDSGEDRIEHVTVGSEITLNITNPDAADAFHIHGIELEQSVGPGVMATFNFTIDAAGTYGVESHLTDDVLIIIEAS